MGVFIFGEFGRNLACLSRQFAPSANRSFKFHKRSQLFICSHNVTLSVAAMCVNNPDCSSRCTPRLKYSPNSNQL